MDQPVRDGFEGMGYLVELLAGIGVVAIAFFALAVLRKLLCRAGGGRVPKSGYVWAAIAAYLVSLVCALQFASLAFTDDALQTGLFASLGTLSAVAALVLAMRGQGNGRIPTLTGSAFLTVVWLPAFWGRVLAHL